MFRRKKQKRIENENENEPENEYTMQGPRLYDEEEPRINIIDYLIILVGVITLISFVFLFNSVLPEWGFTVYKNVMIYAWKPMSWMPLWVGILIAWLIFSGADVMKPVIIYGGNRRWYIRHC